MSERQAVQHASGEGTPEPGTGPGVGPYLRQVRENAGIHIAALAQALKVPVSRLEAVESDRFDLMPDAAFARALAASICRMLQVDPAPVLARLPQRNAARLVDDTRALSKGLPSMPMRKPSLAQQFPKPLFWVVALLLVGAGVLMLLPRDLMGQWIEHLSQRPERSAPDTTAPGSVQEPAHAGAGHEVTEPVAAVEPSAPSVPAATETAAPAAAVPVSAAEAEALVVLKATAESWVKVTDARGTVVFQKILVAGQQYPITAPPPLNVVVGRADGTQVIVRGKPLDLAALARNNVARFEVK